MRLSTKQIALTSVFACFYYLFSFLPGIPAPGIADLKIQVEACFATVFGYILGPFLGASSAFIGAFISWVLPPGNMSPTGLLFLPSPILNAAVSGFLFQRKFKPAIFSLGLLIVSFLLTPPIQPLNEFWNVGLAVVWDKIIALLLIASLMVMDKYLRGVHEGGRTKPSPRRFSLEVLRLFIMAFIGNEVDNIWGSFVFALPFVYETLYQLDVQVVRWLFLVSPFAYPAIRFLQAIIATLIAAPLLRTLRSAKLIET